MSSEKNVTVAEVLALKAIIRVLLAEKFATSRTSLRQRLN